MSRNQAVMTWPARPSVAQVEKFWDEHPLCSYECPHAAGTPAFFQWHDAVRDDVERFALHTYEFDRHAGERVLDVGCGIGWLCVNFAAHGANITGVDLTRRGVELTRQRLRLRGLQGTIVQGSAEELPFPDASFDFVTSAGVLHHTPDTQRGVREIHRVLRPGGRAMISLYYKNWLMSPALWPLTRLAVRYLFGSLPGRSMFRRVQTVNDLVRIYDGNENPLGKAYSRGEVRELMAGFTMERTEIHYFPQRFLPLGHKMPSLFQRWADRFCGLMIYATLRKNDGGKSA